jgi:hypothetical protein
LATIEQVDLFPAVTRLYSLIRSNNLDSSSTNLILAAVKSSYGELAFTLKTVA